MPALFIVQMVLIVIAVTCFILCVWSMSTDPNATVFFPSDSWFDGEGEQGITSSRVWPLVFMGVLIASLWLLAETNFDLCSFLRFWWPGMPPDVFQWSCGMVPKMR